jgi:hypothetical protein
MEMRMKDRFRCLSYLLVTIAVILSCVKDAYANVIFPAIARQFMVSMVVPSYYSVAMAVLILLIEAFFIHKLFTVNYIISFVISFIINLISSVVGAFLTGAIFGVGGREGILGILGYNNMRLGTYLGMLPGYVLTVLLEGLLLFLIGLMVNLIIKRKISMAACMKTSAIMNFFSYLVIIVGVFIADLVTKGANFKTY